MSTNSRPAKRSRIITSGGPLTIDSTSLPFTTVTCTNNNARRLAHTVTLRARHQSAAQTVLRNNQETAEEESAEMDLSSYGTDIGEEVRNIDVETEAPKRRVVRVSFKLEIKQF